MTTMFSDEVNEALAAPLNRANVAQRKQGGGQVSYIAGWHAIAEANRIFGFDGWHREMISLRQLGDPREVNGNIRVDYSAHVRVTVGGIIRDGCGFGQGIDKDVGQAHESALKEAETDAMKRALMTFGNQFGLALYDKEQREVADAPKQMPAAVDKLIAGIRACETVAQLNRWADDNGANANATGFGGMIQGEWDTRKAALEAVAAYASG